MGITSLAGLAAELADRAVDGYRHRLQEQAERRRLDGLHLSLLVNASLAAVGMAAEVLALTVRARALEQAADRAIAAGDLAAAEGLRARLVATLEEPLASTRLMVVLAEAIPTVLGGRDRVIEGEVA